MRRALDYPVDIINDISGIADRVTLETLARRGLTYWAMHMHRDPEHMHKDPLDAAEALRAVAVFYEEAQQELRNAGFTKDRIWLDPGVGFGKTDRANVQVIGQALAESVNYEIVLGVSRKSFIGRLLGITDPKERDAPSKMLELSFLLAGVRGIRTHDVARLRKLRDLVVE
jgi:dihydropteroate synthase